MGGTGYFKKKQDSEMLVITKTKELMLKIFEITDTAPKKYRFSLISRMQNLSMDILKNIYMANDTFIDVKLLKDIDKSIMHYKNLKNLELSEKMHNENRLMNLKLTRALKLEERIAKRLEYQYFAITYIKELDSLLVIAKQMACITSKHQQLLAGLMNDIRNLIGGWIKKEKERFRYQ